MEDMDAMMSAFNNTLPAVEEELGGLTSLQKIDPTKIPPNILQQQIKTYHLAIQSQNKIQNSLKGKPGHFVPCKTNDTVMVPTNRWFEDHREAFLNSPNWMESRRDGFTFDSKKQKQIITADAILKMMGFYEGSLGDDTPEIKQFVKKTRDSFETCLDTIQKIQVHEINAVSEEEIELGSFAIEVFNPNAKVLMTSMGIHWVRIFMKARKEGKFFTSCQEELQVSYMGTSLMYVADNL